jgi:ribosomal protein S18 acetylase RimI-like enzyme
LLNQRPVDLKTDRDFILDLHCLRGWEDLPTWARNPSYYQHRVTWLQTSEPALFLEDLEESLQDERSVAEIWEEDGKPVGFLWLLFHDIEGVGVTFAEVRTLVVSTGHQRRGIGGMMLRRAEEEALQRGAVSLRCEMAENNDAARAMHEKQGFAIASHVYEKALSQREESLAST